MTLLGLAVLVLSRTSIPYACSPAIGNERDSMHEVAPPYFPPYLPAPYPLPTPPTPSYPPLHPPLPPPPSPSLPSARFAGQTAGFARRGGQPPHPPLYNMTPTAATDRRLCAPPCVCTAFCVYRVACGPLNKMTAAVATDLLLCGLPCVCTALCVYRLACGPFNNKTPADGRRVGRPGRGVRGPLGGYHPRRLRPVPPAGCQAPRPAQGRARSGGRGAGLRPTGVCRVVRGAASPGSAAAAPTAPLREK